jgi:hypothetical protein
MKSFRKQLRKFKKRKSRKRGGMFSFYSLGDSGPPTRDMSTASQGAAAAPATQRGSKSGYPPGYKPTPIEQVILGPYGPGEVKPEFKDTPKLPNGGVPLQYYNPAKFQEVGHLKNFVDLGNGAYGIGTYEDFASKAMARKK